MTARLGALGQGHAAALLALAVGLVLAREAVVSPTRAAAAAAGLVLVALAFWRLELGVAVFTVLTFPEKLPGVLGAGATVAKPLGLVILLSWLLAVASSRRIPLLPRDQPASAWLALGFVVWALASSTWATDAGTARSGVFRLVQVMSLLFVAYSAARTARGLKLLLWAFVAGAVLSAGYALATGSYGQGERLSGIFDPNFFATELAAAMVFAGFMLVGARPRTRIVLLAVLALLATAFVLTESRGGIAALGAGLLAAVVLGGRLRARTVAVVLAVAAIGIGYYVELAPPELRARISDVSARGSAGRSDEWRIALRIAGDHPALGVGFNNFPVVEPTYATGNIDLLFVKYVVQFKLAAHNTYLQLLSELGAVGMILFCGLLVTIFGYAVSATRRLTLGADLATEALCRAVVVGGVATLAGYFFLSAQFEKQLWLLLGLVAAVAGIANRAAEEWAHDSGERA